MNEDNVIPAIPDISMIPTGALIDELSKRCSPMVFIGTRYEGDGNEREFKNFSRHEGNLDTCRGMCHELDSWLERQMIREEYERAVGEED